MFTMGIFRFLSMLEEEIYGENSPIWEADFTVPASDGTQLGHQTGEAGVQTETSRAALNDYFDSR